MFDVIGSDEFRPLPPRFCAARAYATGEMFAHSIGNKKLCVLRPAIKALRKAHLLLAERLAMSSGGVMFMRCTVAYMAVQNDEGWTSLGLPEAIQGVLDEAGIVGVAHAQNIPAIA